MKKISDSAGEEAKSLLTKGLQKTARITYFPQEFSTYLLDLKLSSNLPVSLLPDDLFVKPNFKGKTDFFHRLASELISFGLAYQRVNLKPVPLHKITSLFHKHRPWWQCDIQDIETALDVLKKNSIVRKKEDGYIFEPFSVSSEIRTFLSAISDGISDYGEISLTLIEQLVPWENARIIAILEILTSNQICIYDQKNELVYFPGFKK
ncbi:hypothetical protein CEE45_03710 [Candidatus Heimdallarchaeota archaeon B3_Heim]|nr:MAG: hypothetical protein CEE45_03710 [Candidatus Heimdallarchaeota archaeon B3_Heim]